MAGFFSPLSAVGTGLKHFLKLVHTVGEQSVQAIVAGTGGFLSSMAQIPGALLGVGLTTGLSAGIMQVHYKQERDEIREMYKDELGAKLHKAPEKVTDKDLDLLAKGDAKRGIEANPVIADALNKARKQRNVGILTATLASLGTMALTSLLLVGTGGAAAPLAGLVAKMATIGIGKIVADGIVGIVVYEAIKNPLHWVAGKMFGISKEDAHDRIMDVYKDHEKGKAIQREQVIEVLVASNPELNKRIAANFGKSYDEMDATDRQRVNASLANAMPVDALTAGINDGSIKITELAFATETRTAVTARQTIIEPAGNEAPSASFVQRLAMEQQRAAQTQR